MTEATTLRVGMRVRNNKDGRTARVEAFYTAVPHDNYALLRDASGKAEGVPRKWIHADGRARRTGWDVHPADMPEAMPKNALADIPDEALRTELHRRDEARSAALHADRLKRAEYLCPDCGGRVVRASKNLVDLPDNMTV